MRLFTRGWLLVVVLWPALPARAEAIRAGAARVDVTPPVGFPMWGYGARKDMPSTGVHDPLMARAVVLAVGADRIAIVSLDLGRAPTRQHTAAIRRRVKEAAGVGHVFLTASHTHHGPVLELDTWPSRDKPYTLELETKLGDVIIEAAKNLKPARLGVSALEVGLNRNRHSKRADRPIDGELIVVRIEGEEGQVIAHLVNFAAHATMRDGKSREFSADFPGPFAKRVEMETGGVCLYLQGAAGDLSPNPSKRTTPEEFGEELAAKVVQLSKQAKCELKAAAGLPVREHDFNFGKRFDLSNPLIRAAYSLAFFKDLVDFYEREYREGIRPHLTTALLDGRIGIVGVSGEFFCGHSLSLKKRARLEHLLFLGYCNDYQQYFPTIEAISEGGYGADSQVSPVEIGAGERMMNQALVDLFEMRGKIRKDELKPR